MLASQYGGGPQAILEGVSLYELLSLVDHINNRMVFDWKMQVSIATYPHLQSKDQKQFMKNLEKISSSEQRRNQINKLDTVGFEALKFAMSQNPRIVVK